LGEGKILSPSYDEEIQHMHHLFRELVEEESNSEIQRNFEDNERFSEEKDDTGLKSHQEHYGLDEHTYYEVESKVVELDNEISRIMDDFGLEYVVIMQNIWSAREELTLIKARSPKGLQNQRQKK